MEILGDLYRIYIVHAFKGIISGTEKIIGIDCPTTMGDIIGNHWIIISGITIGICPFVVKRGNYWEIFALNGGL